MFQATPTDKFSHGTRSLFVCNRITVSRGSLFGWSHFFGPLSFTFVHHVNQRLLFDCQLCFEVIELSIIIGYLIFRTYGQFFLNSLRKTRNNACFFLVFVNNSLWLRSWVSFRCFFIIKSIVSILVVEIIQWSSLFGPQIRWITLFCLPN